MNKIYKMSSDDKPLQLCFHGFVTMPPDSLTVYFVLLQFYSIWIYIKKADMFQLSYS